MKTASFDSTPEFAHFKEQMRKFITVPKERVDELVREAKATSPHKRKKRSLRSPRKK